LHLYPFSFLLKGFPNQNFVSSHLNFVRFNVKVTGRISASTFWLLLFGVYLHVNLPLQSYVINKLFLYSAIYKLSVTILHIAKKFCILPSQYTSLLTVTVAVNTILKIGFTCWSFNPLNAELNTICYLLALLTL